MNESTNLGGRGMPSRVVQLSDIYLYDTNEWVATERDGVRAYSNDEERSCAARPGRIPPAAADPTRDPRPRSCTASRLACNRRRAVCPGRRRPAAAGRRSC